MQADKILELLHSVKNGKITVNSAADSLKKLPFENIGSAMIDNHRELRRGFPEVIYSPGKTLVQMKKIFQSMNKSGFNILATRAEKKIYNALKKIYLKLEYHEEARIIFLQNNKIKLNSKPVLVASGGTTDIPVAEEAAVTCEKMGNSVIRLYDAGIAGLHRLTVNIDKLNSASVIVAVAGMEGALPSVIAGLIDKPVIAVPTSIGYGANFSGLAPLLAMLNSCSSGIGVVNIDNGFGAGYLAALINRQIQSV